MSMFLMSREESLLLSSIQNLALWRRTRENLQGIARDQLLRMSPLPQVKKNKVVQGKKYSKWWSTPSVSTTSRGRGVFSNSFSSYSSGRQISPLSESVATDHFRQVGSFSTAGGLALQFQSRPPLSSVPLNMSVTRDPDRNLLLQEEVHILLQKGAVELVNQVSIPAFFLY